MASEMLSAGDALAALLAERLGCLAVSGVSEYLLQTTREQTTVHGARAPIELAPPRELMELSPAQRTVQLLDHDQIFARVLGHWLHIKVGKNSWVRRVAPLLMREHWSQPRSSPRHVWDGRRASIEYWDTCSTTFCARW